ncbi:MAG: DinB family protein [Cyclobacteriaceae bacterium]|nr:DinB family protein [Cyclobacteriaceae bacterium]
MTLDELIKDYKEVFSGKPWYGVSVFTSLEKIEAEHWNRPLKDGRKTIAQMVLHMIAWRRFTIEKLKRNEHYTIKLNSSEDWPTDETKREKNHLLGELQETQQEIIGLLENLDDGFLKEKISGGKAANELLIKGLIHHDIYHLGQINLINSQLNPEQ